MTDKNIHAHTVLGHRHGYGRQTLINRATGGRERNQENSFRPEWFYHLVDDPFWIYCQHHVSDEKAVDETTLYDEHLMQKEKKRMWEGFLDWLGDPSDVALYCWTMYEEGKIEQEAEDHPELSAENAERESLV